MCRNECTVHSYRINNCVDTETHGQTHQFLLFSTASFIRSKGKGGRGCVPVRMLDMLREEAYRNSSSSYSYARGDGGKH